MVAPRDLDEMEMEDGWNGLRDGTTATRVNLCFYVF